jgi:NADPH:quinone reductase-like Zn-dependent oxidoreductase
MQAVVFHAHGSADVLVEATLPDPVPAPGQARVEVHACALNRLDLAVRRGLPGLRVALPHVLGSDVAGVVDAVGPGVDAGLVGREVVLNPGWSCGRCAACLSGRDNLCREYAILGEHVPGGYAQRVCVPAANLLAKPPRLSMIEAAAVPLTFLTAWQMLVRRADLRPGQTVLLHAAGSGVGTAGLQIARLLGGRVVALAGSDAKLARAREHGAEATVCSAAPDWPAQVRAIPWVGKRGVDVVFEHVGASTWSRSIELCTRGGRIVTCGATSGHEAVTDLRHVFYRQIQILGSTMGSKADLFPVLDLVARGILSPVIDRVFPLGHAPRAHEHLEARAQYGKVVLEVRPPG